MLRRRAWLYPLAIFISLVVFYITLAHEPVNVYDDGFQPEGYRPAPAKSVVPATRIDSTSRDGLEEVLGPLRQYEDGFTIISPTYHRTEALPEYLDNYATGLIPSLTKIVLIWNNEEDPPASFNASLADYSVPVILERRARNSKNERFRRTPAITTAAVLALDDDMVIRPRDVEYTFQAWQEYRYPRARMAGFIRRRVNERGLYSRFPDPEGYSMVLTKAAFIHVDWMDLWWADTEEMNEFREYIDARKLPAEYPDLKTGCEDIAMSYLYAHHTREPPLWVAGAGFHDIGQASKDGISSHKGHNAARQACVRHFDEVFGEDTLIDTQLHESLTPGSCGRICRSWYYLRSHVDSVAYPAYIY